MADGYQEIREACRTLGIGDRASRKEIQARYRKLAKACHPDAGADGAGERIYAVNAAYRLLVRYVDAYRFDFTEAQYVEQNPEERFRRQFGSDPLWGKE